MTVFIKRSPSKGQLPKVSGEYDTSNGNICFENVHNKFFNHKGELTLEPEWFLEEIELPSKEDIENMAEEFAFPNSVKIGANFILNHIKGG